MNLAQMQTYIYKRTKTNATSFPNADMVIELNAANNHVLSLIRSYKDVFYPTDWTTSDLSTGTAVPVFDSMFHELIPLWVVHHYTSDSKLRSQVADEVKLKERLLTSFYHTRSFLPFTITIASPGVATLVNHNFRYAQEVILSTTSALPTGLSAATIYYVIPITDDTFSLSSSLTTMTAINTSGSQSGTHYISGIDVPKMTMQSNSFI